MKSFKEKKKNKEKINHSDNIFEEIMELIFEGVLGLLWRLIVGFFHLLSRLIIAFFHNIF